MKITPVQRKMAKRLIRGNIASWNTRESVVLNRLKGIGIARESYGWWMPTGKTILATLTPAQYLVAEKLLGFGQIDRHDYKQCPGRTPTVLGALANAGLAEALTPPGWAECNFWKPTEKLKKAFAVDGTGETK